MDIKIRQMRHGEAQEVKQIAYTAFTGVESWGVPKAKTAMVAECNGKIVGAIIFKIIHAKKKIGYVDYAFVHEKYHNKGIGGQLYRETIEYLWKIGCDAITTLVKDDNVASFGLFMKNGLKRVSLGELVKELGIAGAFMQYFNTATCLGVGMDSYLAIKEKTMIDSKSCSLKELFFYFLINFFVLSMSLIYGTSKGYLQYIITLLLLLAGGVFTSYIPTLFSKQKWRFRLNHGGVVVCALVSMGSCLPMYGNWYPDAYEDTKAFQKEMGIGALLRWLFYGATTALALFGSKEGFLNIVGQVGVMFLIYHIIAVYPFASFGGGRVFKWNKWIYIGMSILSVVLIYFVW